MRPRADIEREIGQAVVRGDLVAALELVAELERSVGQTERIAVHQVRMQLLTALFKDKDDTDRDHGSPA